MVQRGTIHTKAVISALQELDGEMWNTIVSTYERRLKQDIRASLRRMGTTPDAVDDIAQETWVIAVAKIASFQGHDPIKFYHWLRTISFNLVRNHVRKVVRAAPYSDVLDDATVRTNLRLAAPDVEATVILRERTVAAQHLLERLKPRDRDIVIRRYVWEELPIEIAQHYPELKSRSVSQVLHRFRKSLALLVD